MTTSAAKRLTVDEYLALEPHSDVKHEYFDGELFAMAGGTQTHALLGVNFSGELRNALKGSGCRVYSSDLMVWCPTGLRTYPDVSITCCEPRFESDKELTLINPQVLIEVLSASTEAYDRGRKFDHYQTIESLREYVLVSQDRAHIDHFARQADGRWLLTAVSALSASVELPTLRCSIPMAEIYAGVTFDPPAEPSAESGEKNAE